MHKNVIGVVLVIVVMAGCTPVSAPSTDEAATEQGDDSSEQVMDQKDEGTKMEKEAEQEVMEEKQELETLTNNEQKMEQENQNYDLALAETCTGAVVTTNKGVFELEFYGADAPHAVANFCTLAQKGFYDGVIFHRIIKGFMIQGGDPQGTGMGGPGYNIQDDVSPKSNLTYTISMANTGRPNSGGSQFFINTADNINLDHDKEPLSSKHPVFGKVISGTEVIDAIESVVTGFRDKPEEDVVIEKVEVKSLNK